MSEVAVKDLKLSVACKKDQMSPSSSAAAITTEDAAIGQHVAVDFGPEHGIIYAMGRLQLILGAKATTTWRTRMGRRPI
jgi:hypothetical protein